MAVGDVHQSDSNGFPLCGSNGPLRGYNATSVTCRDCDDTERREQWRLQPPAYMPRAGSHMTAHALLRKRPTRIFP